jgi:hypothetical protein
MLQYNLTKEWYLQSTDLDQSEETNDGSRRVRGLLLTSIVGNYLVEYLITFPQWN